jgi:hypothetical protein
MRGTGSGRSGWAWLAIAGVIGWTGLAGCSASITETDTGFDASTDVKVDTSDVQGGDSDVQSDADTQVAVTEDFWITYGRRDLLNPGSTANNDVVLTHWKNPHMTPNEAGQTPNPLYSNSFGTGINPLNPDLPAIKLTEYSFKKAGNLNCNFGCTLSRNLKYIAIAEGAPSETGYTFILGTINPQLEVFVGKFGVIKDVAHLAFAGDYLFYSTYATKYSSGKWQFDIHRRDLTGKAAPEDIDVVLTKMAPDAEVDKDVPIHTTYNGFFQASEDGKTLVFLTPTIRSVKVWAWRDGNVTRLDYICDHPLSGEDCVGTGSQYHSDDRVGITEDGKTIVLFTIVYRWLRVRKYTLGGQEAPTFTNLVEVPNDGHAYKKKACDVVAAEMPWMHTEVRGQPQFSADGTMIYFLGFSDCAAAEDKPYTDILALPLSKIGDGTPFTQDDLYNLTNNPRDNSVANKRVFDFTVSPQRQVLIISATRAYGQDGFKLKETDHSKMENSEIYTMIVGTGKMVPITNELKFGADSPQSVYPVAP